MPLCGGGVRGAVQELGRARPGCVPSAWGWEWGRLGVNTRVGVCVTQCLRGHLLAPGAQLCSGHFTTSAGTRIPVCPSFFSSRCSFLPAPCAVRASSSQPSSCQSVSNLQLLRLFSSLLPLGSVSGTVSLFFYLFTLPFPSLSLHPAHPLTQPVLSDLPSPSLCLSVLTHFFHK